MISQIPAKLFKPVKIGKMEVKNRVVMPAVTTFMAGKDGQVNERIVDYYEERAKGGVGLIIVEGAYVDITTGQDWERILRVDDDTFIPGLRKLAEAIQSHGAKACLQLQHAGALAIVSAERGVIPLSPSGVLVSPQGRLPREATINEIEGLIKSFAVAAKRAKQAGFDAVEVHGGHSYLVSEFLSPLYNKRTDAWGGDLNGRAKFLLQIVRAIKKECGNDYPVMVRISAEEYEEGGIKLEDSQKLASLMESVGVDAINVSYGTHWSPEPLAIAPACFPQGTMLHLAQGIKNSVGVPVIGGGRINSFEVAEKALEEGKADLIFLGRALLADPHWVNKAASGRTNEICRCLACTECAGGGEGYTPGIDALCCVINPALGQEREYRIFPATVKKKVVVVGGGPAGMEAALFAAQRGHQVTLYEKGDMLGGQLLLAGRPPYKTEVEELRSWLECQVRKLSIKVELGTEFTSETAAKMQPDVVIVATGVHPFFPDIPGIYSQKVVTAEMALTGKDVGEKVIIIGAETVACETAEFLADRGKRITMFDIRGGAVATKAPIIARTVLLRRLRQKGVKIRPRIYGYGEITGKGLTFLNEEGMRETLEADTIVLAAGSVSNTWLASKLKGKVPELYFIGDCVKPRNIRHAMHEGATLGIQV